MSGDTSSSWRSACNTDGQWSDKRISVSLSYGISMDNWKNILSAYKYTIDLSHTHSVSGSTGGAGKHSHTRGTMNITGEFSSDEFGSELGQTKTGCFKNSGVNYSQNTEYGSEYHCANLVFDASLSWTGNTSVEPSHTHSFSGSTGGMDQNATFNHGGHTMCESNSSNVTNVGYAEHYNHSNSGRHDGRVYSINISHTHSFSGVLYPKHFIIILFKLGDKI